MNIREISDPDGDALTVTRRSHSTWVTCTSDHTEVTVGPIPNALLLDTTVHGDDEMDGGVMCGQIENDIPVAPEGDAAFWRARAERAEHHRDQYRADAIKAEQGRDAETVRADKNRDLAVNWQMEALKLGRAEQARAFTVEQHEQIRLGKLVQTIRDGGGAVEVYGVTIAPSADVQHMAERIDGPRPLTPEDITDEMVERAWTAFWDAPDGSDDVHSMRIALHAALTEPPARPEGSEELESLIREANREGEGIADKLADRLTSRGVRVAGAES